ncbi:uncharacterized protein LOC122789381 [Protopterus annectens]|uniref:uncharacterized protein LOC122789381 n=1 Tax=Protopterus annectens TaxID=7888 RepID=UPI001CFA7D1A|nr:uncharacterized protein LOC122789381 [Protopterus annectens]XP_043912720.1 uncharacterized protein LOC122789381 [Protopterus annectens]XP_043912721.1 uncharacterized protein LOC122789381 [Protopterus annectens]XP_043912722.1 uncharacterized protein LOC122789381 [Protopterus annectens]
MDRTKLLLLCIAVFLQGVTAKPLEDKNPDAPYLGENAVKGNMQLPESLKEMKVIEPPEEKEDTVIIIPQMLVYANRKHDIDHQSEHGEDKGKPNYPNIWEQEVIPKSERGLLTEKNIAENANKIGDLIKEKADQSYQSGKAVLQKVAVNEPEDDRDHIYHSYNAVPRQDVAKIPVLERTVAVNEPEEDRDSIYHALPDALPQAVIKLPFSNGARIVDKDQEDTIKERIQSPLSGIHYVPLEGPEEDRDHIYHNFPAAPQIHQARLQWPQYEPKNEPEEDRDHIYHS